MNWSLDYYISMKRFSNHLLQLLLGALLLHLIWLLGYVLLRTEVLPAPWLVYQHLVGMDWSDLLLHATASLERIAWGILIATILAWGIALTMILAPRLGKVFSTFIYFSYPIPSSSSHRDADWRAWGRDKSCDDCTYHPFPTSSLDA